MLIPILCLAAVVLLAVLFFVSPAGVRTVRKSKVKKVLRAAKREGATVLRRLTVATDGARVKVDYALIAPTGVFFLAVPSYTGTLYAHAERSEWTDVGKDGKPRAKFANPLPALTRAAARATTTLHAEHTVTPLVVLSGRIGHADGAFLATVKDFRRVLKKPLPLPIKARERAAIRDLLKTCAESDPTPRPTKEKPVKREVRALAAGCCPRCGRKLTPRTRRGKKTLVCPVCHYKTKG